MCYKIKANIKSFCFKTCYNVIEDTKWWLPNIYIRRSDYMSAYEILSIVLEFATLIVIILTLKDKK